jgi:hypothetical protein
LPEQDPRDERIILFSSQNSPLNKTLFSENLLSQNLTHKIGAKIPILCVSLSVYTYSYIIFKYRLCKCFAVAYWMKLHKTFLSQQFEIGSPA